MVIDLSGPTPHTEGRLTGPDRVFFDLHGATPDDGLERRAFPIEGSHLRRIRLGVPEEKVTRVVLDFSSIREVSVFALPDPYRLVVDIHGAPPVQVADGSGDETAPETDDSRPGRRRAPRPRRRGPATRPRPRCRARPKGATHWRASSEPA